MWLLDRDVLFEFHLKFWNTTNIGIPVKSLYTVDRLLTGRTAQQSVATAQWYSNETSLQIFLIQTWLKIFTYLPS